MAKSFSVYLIYTSLAVRLWNLDELLELLEKSGKEHEKAGIAGVLIYMESRFISKLESRLY